MSAAARLVPLIVIGFAAPPVLAQADKGQVYAYLGLGGASTEPVTPDSTSLGVRPNVANAAAVYVRSDRDDTVADIVVRVLSGDKLLAAGKVTAGPKKSTRVALDKLAAAIAVSTGADAVLTLEVSKPGEIDTRETKVSLAALRPGDGYLQEIAANFSEVKKFVTLTVPASKFDGPPVPLELDLSRVPGLRKPVKGSLKLQLPSEQPGELTAGPLEFAAERPVGSVVAVSADGVPRALVFDGQLKGGNVLDKYQPATAPEVRVAGPNVYAPVYLKADGKKFTLVGEVFSAPAAVEKFVLTLTPVDQTNPARTITFASDRARSLVVGPAEGGGMTLEMKVGDPTWVIDPDGLLGQFKASGTLFFTGEDGRKSVASKDPLLVVIDNTPPVINLSPPPARLKRGQPLELSATVTDPETPVSAVKFVVDGQKFIASKGAGNTYTLSLPLPEDKLGTVGVEAEAVNAAGLEDRTAKAAVFVFAPSDDPNKPGAAALGSVKGVVVRGDLPQQKKKISIYDESGNMVKEVTTNAKGEFAFKDLKPGKYNLFSTDPAFGYRAVVPVEVVAEKETAGVVVKLKL